MDGKHDNSHVLNCAQKLRYWIQMINEFQQKMDYLGESSIFGRNNFLTEFYLPYIRTLNY
jgi:hypothetical protein